MPAQGMVQGRGPPCPVQSGRLEKSSYPHGEMEAAESYNPEVEDPGSLRVSADP